VNNKITRLKKASSFFRMMARKSDKALFQKYFMDYVDLVDSLVEEIEANEPLEEKTAEEDYKQLEANDTFQQAKEVFGETETKSH